MRRPCKDSWWMLWGVSRPDVWIAAPALSALWRLDGGGCFWSSLAKGSLSRSPFVCGTSLSTLE